jgi:hypothetical protein
MAMKVVEDLQRRQNAFTPICFHGISRKSQRLELGAVQGKMGGAGAGVAIGADNVC